MAEIDQKIRNALLHLMRRKRFENITMKEIALESGVNRSTVYRHYIDKFEIMNLIEDNILHEFADAESLDTSNNFVSESSILIMLKAIDERRGIIRLLLSENGDARFKERLSRFLTTQGLHRIDVAADRGVLDIRQKELLVQYISSAILGLVGYWAEHPEMGVEELDTLFEKLFRSGINSFLAH